jgi:hypothetical protein
VSTDVTIYEFPAFSGYGAYFDYFVTNTLGYQRLGTVMATWNFTGATWTDTSTTDLDGSTEDLAFEVISEFGNVKLNTIVTGGVWTIRLSVRVIY